MNDASLQASLEDWSRPALLPGAELVDIDAFVREHGERRVQERLGRLPVDFRYCRLDEFYAQAQASPHQWGVDEAAARYVFHDHLLEEGATQVALEEFFDRHAPPDAFVTMSETWPCVAIRLALSGPDSHTPVHYHGATTCALLHGSKQWWLWSSAVRDLVWWLGCGLRGRNRLASWEEHVAPRLESATGDARELVWTLVEELEASGRFLNPGAEHPAARTIERLRAGEGRIPLAEELRGIRFTQQAGEIAYVPSSWCHAVRNDAWHLAVIHELTAQAVQA
jgi:hypothetical protein